MRARLARGAGANAFGQLVIACLQLGTVPVLVAHWGLETYGVWILLFTVPAYLGLGDLGFATAAGIEMRIAAARNDHAKAVEIFQSALVFVIVAAILLFALGVLVVMLLPDKLLATGAYLSPDDIRCALLVLVGYGVISLAGSIVLTGLVSSGFYATGTMTQSVVQLLEGVLCIVVVSLGGSIVSVAVGYLSVRILSVAAQSCVLWRLVPWLHLGFARASRRQVATLLRPAVAVLALSGGQAAILIGTIWTLGAATNAATVAIFATTRTLIRTGIQITGLLNRALMPEFSGAIGRGDIEAQKRMLLLTFVSSFAILVPSGLVLIFGGRWIIALWTRGAIIVSERFLLLMVAVMIIEGLWYPVSNLILSANRHASYAYAFLLASLTSLALSYPLAGIWGENGTAIAILVMEVFMLVYIARLSFAIMPHVDLASLPGLLSRVIRPF